MNDWFWKFFVVILNLFFNLFLTSFIREGVKSLKVSIFEIVSR